MFNSLANQVQANTAVQNNNLSLSYISSVLFRVLPNQKINLAHLNDLYSSSSVKSYFKRIRKLQEYPQLYHIFKRSGKFDMSLTDFVRGQLSKTEGLFKDNILTFSDMCNNRNKFLGLCGITQSHLDYVFARFERDVLQTSEPRFTRPSIDDVLTHINWRASMALPEPRLKKKEFRSEIEAYLHKFYEQALSPTEIFQHPSAIFMRSQIRESGLKVRTVHAVQGFQQSLESYYHIYFKTGLPIESALALGLTQQEISEKVESYRDMYTYSIDYQKWDNTRQPVLSVVAFELIRKYLPLTEYEDRILVTLRNIYLTLPSYHPTIPLRRRWIGAVSGSGFTTLDNSICNFVLTHVVMLEYFKIKGLDPKSAIYKFNVTGDDIVLGCNFRLDTELFFTIAKRMFGAVAKLEAGESVPGNSVVHYLGSEWIDGFPYRSEKVMVASVIFGSGNFPMMSTYELLTSRFIEVFGNSADCGDLYKRLQLPPPRRVFLFAELTSPFKSGSPERLAPRLRELYSQDLNLKDSRGFWYNKEFSLSQMNLLWASR